jgi:hypothetical protein
LLEKYEETGKVAKIDFEAAVEQAGGDPEARRQIKELKDRLEARDRQLTNHNIAEAVGRAVESRPILDRASRMSNKKLGRDVIVEKLVQGILADPAANVEALADALATEYQAFLPETPDRSGEVKTEQYAKDKAVLARALATESPNGITTTPDAAPRKPAYTLADWKSGNLTKAAVAYLAKRQGERQAEGG